VLFDVDLSLGSHQPAYRLLLQFSAPYQELSTCTQS